MQSTIKDEQLRSSQSHIEAINEAIAAKIGQQKYRIWFKDSTRLSLAEGFLKVGVENLFIANWIENHFSSEISQAVKSVTGETLKLSFSIDSELAGAQRRPNMNSSAAVSKTRAPAKSRDKDKSLRLTLETFIVGPSNELAYNAARVVVSEESSPFNPLFFHGGYGVGKTHLLQGISNAVKRQRPGTRWLYLSAEDFANQFVLALKTKKLEAFRARIRQTDLLAIDDIHFLASKSATQEEFFHTFNSISLAGKQVVLASDAHPKMIDQLSDKLVSRFVSGMVVKIEPPDFKTRCEICRQYAENIGKSPFYSKSRSFGSPSLIPESVIKYVAENLKSNVRELEGALLKLIAFASLNNNKVTLATAREVLNEHLARTDPIVHISDIEAVVAGYFGITPSNIHSSKKDRTVALARHFSMYLTRKHTSMSSSEIGRFMGGKNHATVLLACRKIDSLLKDNADINWQGPGGNRIAKAQSILSDLEATISS